MTSTRIYPLLTCIFAFLLSSCDGLFEDIYDRAPADTEFEEGFVRDESNPCRYTLMIDARDYYTWHYISLEDLSIEPIGIPTELEGEWDGKSGWTYNLVEGEKFTKTDFKPKSPQKDAAKWDFAIHHFDIRTNGGAAATTKYSSIDELPESGYKCAEDEMADDIWSTTQVIVDLGGMMAYNIGYQNSYVNMPLSSMVTMDFSTPPPTYHPSGKVCMLRMADGSMAAIHLKSYMSPKGTKGFLTFDIIYPYH